MAAILRLGFHVVRVTLVSSAPKVSFGLAHPAYGTYQTSWMEVPPYAGDPSIQPLRHPIAMPRGNEQSFAGQPRKCLANRSNEILLAPR